MTESDGQQPLVISQSTLDELREIEERDRAAGGFPWEVPDHPDNSLPGGWHHGQITHGRDFREDRD